MRVSQSCWAKGGYPKTGLDTERVSCTPPTPTPCGPPPPLLMSSPGLLLASLWASSAPLCYKKAKMSLLFSSGGAPRILPHLRLPAQPLGSPVPDCPERSLLGQSFPSKFSRAGLGATSGT